MSHNSCHIPCSPAPARTAWSGRACLVRLRAVTVATLLCTALAYQDSALALSLGGVTVQSSLGEPLRAEIDVLEITAEEATSLRVGVAPADAFRAAGMGINPILSELQIGLQRRTKGRHFLTMTSAQPINEPFIDMILEASWVSGRLLREYTLLFYPPSMRQQVTPTPWTPSVPTAPMAQKPAAPAVQVPPVLVSPAAPPVQTPPVVVSPAPASATTTVGETPASPKPPVEAPRPIPERAQASSPSASSAASGGQQLSVQAGDTAGQIAARHLPSNVSLDQMLVAMLRGNPEAFIGGNVNRIKAGAVLDLPSRDQADAIAQDEARQMIAAQSRDFNEFRRRLAGQVPAAAVAAADRQATGLVQAEVKDKAPTPPTQDKLTLSKSANSASTAQEDKIAQERQRKETADRTAELSRNIKELSKLGSSTAAATAPVGTSTTGGTTTSAVTAKRPNAMPAPGPYTEDSGVIAQLRGNPLSLPIAIGLLALLTGLGLYRLTRRKQHEDEVADTLSSPDQPDANFGPSDDQHLDAGKADTGAFMGSSPGALDAAGDVDPVAEADVYLAYGRDLQAEEILKDAMRSMPARVDIQTKLLEIYARRRDAKAFKRVALETYGLTQGQGPGWKQASELGKVLDPSDPLYQTVGRDDLLAPTLETDNGSSTAPKAFNLSDINLDLNDTPATGQAVNAPSGPGRLSAEDALLRNKLALAAQFRAAGDFMRARSLATEVLADASGQLKTEAEDLLKSLA